MQYKHIVLFKIHPEVSGEDFNKALELLTDLGKSNPDIAHWNINQSLDVRKGRVIIENSTFIDEKAFQKFRISDKHKSVGEFMKEIADWIVGDYQMNS